MRFGAGGELREGDFVFLEAEYVDVAVELEIVGKGTDSGGG